MLLVTLQTFTHRCHEFLFIKFDMNSSLENRIPYFLDHIYYFPRKTASTTEIHLILKKN